VLATGDISGYYADYAAEPARHLGRALAEGLAYQGEPSPFRDGSPRGEPSGELPATAFVGFLQNHDQVGNHPFGTRIAARSEEAALHAAISIVLLSPQIPLLFMGEEWASKRPFAFFCDFEPGLRNAVREGRRREFAHFPELHDEAARERIPDPTASSTFELSRLDWSEPQQERYASWLTRYRRLIELRAREIAPRLPGMPPFAGSYQVLGPKAVRVEWLLGDRARLGLLANFGNTPVSGNLPEGKLIYASAEQPGTPFSAAFFLAEPKKREAGSP
jgi:1,4-alpha-glucan branching enzyme/maltooligosyltrehalose trehalohydrolase